MRWRESVLALLILPLGAVAADGVQNPPPTRPFSGYASYELKELEFEPGVLEKKGNENAIAQLRHNVEVRFGALVAQWNERAQPETSSGTLQIVPRIARLKYSSSDRRWAAGAFAGSSEVVLSVTFVEAPDGPVVAAPEFYQSAAALSGAWTFGGADNAMLARVVRIAAVYMSANYTQAVGGKTGRP